MMENVKGINERMGIIWKIPKLKKKSKKNPYIPVLCLIITCLFS